MNNAEVYSTLNKIIKDHEKKELLIKIVEKAIEAHIDGEKVDFIDLLNTIKVHKE